MAKTLNAAGVKRLIQEIKGANKNLNTAIPISMENTPESKAQNVKNIADYVEKVKAAGIADVNGMAVTCIIDGDYSGVGYIYKVGGVSYINGIITCEDASNPFTFVVQGGDGTYMESELVTRSSNNQITSYMLVEGARKPIILTPSTTEVDEETYQKLLSDDVDVLLKSNDDGYCQLTYKFNGDTACNFYFTVLSAEGGSFEDTYLYGYHMSINNTAPHKVTFELLFNTDIHTLIDNSGFINKSTLSPVLQEIDLSGTDADRKAKLDYFETYWKALTGADYLTGARFVGKFGITDDVERNVTGIMTYCVGDDTNETNDNCFYGICNSYSFSEQKSQIAVKVSCKDGSLTITPLFSHLETITIYTDNTPEHMQANLDNIAAYEANLQALGVDISSKSHIIPFGQDDFEGDGYGRGYLVADDNAGDVYLGQFQITDGTIYSITINGQGEVDNVRSILNDYYQSLNAKSLEAITIYTDNTDKHKAANVAAIKAYVDNLIALGVDTTKGYIIPITDGKYQGTLMSPDSRKKRYRGQLYKDDEHYCPLYIEEDGAINVSDIFISYTANLSTTSTQVVGAINEVNALAKSKQDKLTSGTNIKTVNGQSLLGSGDIAISGGGGDVTAAGNNTFTGTNTFDTVTNLNSGLIIRDATNDDRYKIHGDAFGLIMQNIDDLNSDIGIRGVLSPVQDNDAANKSYVDTQISTALGTVLTQLQNI